MSAAVLPGRLIRASHLKRQRGWTETLIEQLLGPADALAHNPHGFRPAMRLFCERRVLAAETQAPFAARLERLPERVAWRRGQPTRVFVPAELEGVHPLPAKAAQTALFAARPHAPLPRPSARRLRERRLTAAAAPPRPVAAAAVQLRLF